MPWIVLAVGAVLVYLTWLLFSRSIPRISKSAVFSLWMLVFGLALLMMIAVTVFLRHG